MCQPFFKKCALGADCPSCQEQVHALYTKPPSVILFDLDGTLVDTMPAFAHIAARILEREVGLSYERAFTLYLETSGVPFALQLEQIVPDHPCHEVMAAEFEANKLEVSVSLAPDTQEMLQALKDVGIRLVISSNNYQENVTRFAERSPIQFDLALGYDGVRNSRKGGPHVDTARRTFCCDHHEMLMVGDSLSDAISAQHCGIKFIAVTGTTAAERFLQQHPSMTCIKSIGSLHHLLGIASPQHTSHEI